MKGREGAGKRSPGTEPPRRTCSLHCLEDGQEIGVPRRQQHQQSVFGQDDLSLQWLHSPPLHARTHTHSLAGGGCSKGTCSGELPAAAAAKGGSAEAPSRARPDVQPLHCESATCEKHTTNAPHARWNDSLPTFPWQPSARTQTHTHTFLTHKGCSRSADKQTTTGSTL